MLQINYQRQRKLSPNKLALLIYHSYHLRATLIGVVKQDVNRSAGRSGNMGRSSAEPHAANWMQFLTGGITGAGEPCASAR